MSFAKETYGFIKPMSFTKETYGFLKPMSFTKETYEFIKPMSFPGFFLIKSHLFVCDFFYS